MRWTFWLDKTYQPKVRSTWASRKIPFCSPFWWLIFPFNGKCDYNGNAIKFSNHVVSNFLDPSERRKTGLKRKKKQTTITNQTAREGDRIDADRRKATNYVVNSWLVNEVATVRTLPSCNTDGGQVNQPATLGWLWISFQEAKLQKPKACFSYEYRPSLCRGKHKYNNNNSKKKWAGGKIHEKKSLKEPQSFVSFIFIFFSHLATL